MENITRPGLIVLQEWWGLNDHIKDIANRLTTEGFVSMPVDLYDGKVTKDPDEAKRLMMAMDKGTAMEKLNNAVRSLKDNPQVSSVGVIGFCMGGFLSLSLACNNPDIRATVAFYGSVPPDAMLAKLSAPVLYFYGEKDHHIAASDVDRLEKFNVEVVRYRDADHAFFNDTRKEVYNAENAKDAWSRALAFLRKNLK
jgi:carboxymethylenebutenolidase